MTAPGPLFDPVRERAWESWHAGVIRHAGVILGRDIAAVSHEAFCAGWEAARRYEAARREAP